MFLFGIAIGEGEMLLLVLGGVLLWVAILGGAMLPRRLTGPGRRTGQTDDEQFVMPSADEQRC
jgi:hypothetical protein